MWRRAKRTSTQPLVPEGLAPHSQAHLIATRAVTRGIEVTHAPNRWLELRYDKRTHRFRSGRSTLNTQLAQRCTQQKEVTSRLLRAQGVAAPENALFHRDDLRRAWAWAEPVRPVVVKPHAASKGTLVHVGVAEHDDFAAAFNAVAEQYGEVLIEVFIPGAEHRFAVLDHRVIAITQRVPPAVVGDGIAAVSTLIEAKNRDRRARNNPLHRKPIVVDEAVIGTLRSQDLALDSVPIEGQQVLLRRTSNISIGGEAVDKTDTMPPAVVAQIEQASRAIPGLRLAGIDVLLPEQEGGDPTILEVNPSPMLSMHVFPWTGKPRDVYDQVLDAMFPATAAPRPDQR